MPSAASVYEAEQAVVRSGLSVEPSASKYQAFSMPVRKCTLAAKFSPVWQPWVQTGRPAADASAAIRSASVMPPQRDRSGCMIVGGAAVDEPLEVIPGVQVLARRQRQHRAGQRRCRAPGPVLVGRDRLLEPACPRLGQHREHRADVVDRVTAVGVGQQRHVRAELGTQRQGPFDITVESVAEPQLDGAVPAGDLLGRLLGDCDGLGVAEREAARVGGHRSGRPAQQPVQRLAERLALDVPERHVDPAHCADTGGAGAVVGEHTSLEDVPDGGRGGRVEPGEQVAEGGVDGSGDGQRRPAVIGLAVADETAGGGDLYDHRVPLGDRAEALGDLLLERDRARERLDGGDGEFLHPLETGKAEDARQCVPLMIAGRSRRISPQTARGHTTARQAPLAGDPGRGAHGQRVADGLAARRVEEVQAAGVDGELERLPGPDGGAGGDPGGPQRLAAG